MADDRDALSDSERAELEKLRAEKAAREKAQKEARERAELERLRAEQAQSEQERQEEERIAAAKERGAKFMEPDDDLKMPVGQKIVLLVIFALAAVVVLALAKG